MTKRITFFLVAALTALALGGVANAQGSGSANQQQAQQLMQQYRQKAAKLQKIHTETIQANPDLADEQDKFEKQVRKAVENQGYDIDKGQQRVQKMAQKLQSGDLSDSERKAVLKDFQAERRQMVQARDKVLQEPEIQSSGKQLQQHTLAAMKRQDDNTSQLLDDMDSLRTRLRKAMPAPSNGGS